jgi:hypothetical protein
MSKREEYDVLIQNGIEPTNDLSKIGTCLLCRVLIPDSYNLGNHILSRRHKQNLDWFQRILAAKKMDKFVSVKETHPFGNKGDYETELYEQMIPPPNFVIDYKIIQSLRELPEGIRLREWEYYCSLCDSKLHTEDSIANHVTGHSHMAVCNLLKLQSTEREGKKQHKKLQDTDWESAVRAGRIPPPPLNRRPMY